MMERSFTNYVVVCSSPAAVTESSNIAPVLSKDFLDIQTITEWECRFTVNVYATLEKSQTVKAMKISN